MNKLHLPNFFCLDRILGSFFSGLIKLIVFIAIIYLIGLDLWKRYKGGKKKEGLTPGQPGSSLTTPGSTSARTQPSPTTIQPSPANINSPGQNRPSIKYDPNNMDNYSSIRPEVKGSDKEANQTNFDVSLNLIDPYPVYYEPGSFTFNSTGYIPSYEDSIYISKSTNLSQVAKIEDAPYKQGGFCKEFENDIFIKNEKCGTLKKDICGSTDCCILMGGTKCVSGNEFGPSVNAVFSDVTIKNRDHWYYREKCYGHCK
jgi:hypothetical protein